MNKIFIRSTLHAATGTVLVQAVQTSNNSTGAGYTDFKTDPDLSKAALLEMAEKQIKSNNRLFCNTGGLAKHINDSVASFIKSQDEIAARQGVFAELVKGMGFNGEE